MELNEAKQILEKKGYIVEKIDTDGGPIYRTREGIVTNKPTSQSIAKTDTAFTLQMQNKTIDDLIDKLSMEGNDIDVPTFIKKLQGLKKSNEGMLKVLKMKSEKDG